MSTPLPGEHDAALFTDFNVNSVMLQSGIFAALATGFLHRFQLISGGPNNATL